MPKRTHSHLVLPPKQSHSITFRSWWFHLSLKKSSLTAYIKWAISSLTVPRTYIKWTSLNGDAWGATWQGCCWRDAHFNRWWNFSNTQSWDPRVPFTTVNSHNPEGQPPIPRAALVNAIAWNTESLMSLTPDRSRLRAKSRVFTSQRCLLNLSSRDQLHSGHVNLFQELRYFILAIALEQDGGSGEPSLQVKFPQGSCSPWRT